MFCRWGSSLELLEEERRCPGDSPGRSEWQCIPSVMGKGELKLE